MNGPEKSADVDSAAIARPDPVADSLDRKSEESATHLRERLAESEAARAELERLNQFSRLLNSATDLDEVLDRIFDYISGQFDIGGVWLLLIDPAGELYTSRVPRSIEANFPEREVEFVRGFRMALDHPRNSFVRVIERRRPLYFRRVVHSRLDEIDAEIARRTQLKSVLMVPLIVRDEVIGIVNFTNHDQRLRLSRESIAAIDRFCDSVAGAISRSSLFDRIRSERAAADRLRLEIETLNEFSRKINTGTSLDEIIDDIFAYLENTFGFEAVILALPDTDASALRFYRHSVPDHMSPEQLDFLNSYSVPLTPEGGAIARVFERKKPYYQSRITKTYFESDAKFVDLLKPGALVMIPLVIKDRSIGLVMCTSKQSQEFQRDGMGSVAHFCEQIAGAVYSASLLDQVNAEREKSDNLLRNILPEQVAEEIKEHGSAAPTNFESATVLFTDFVGFTAISERLTPADLVRELDGCFSQFDDIAIRHGLEKLKTIGDAYMCAGGLPAPNQTHAVDVCLAALEFQAFMEKMKEIKTSLELPFWELRIGIHTGPLTAGVVGKNKFAYDIWGDSVNTASRCESAGLPGRINISGATHERVQAFFECESRGPIAVKGKGSVEMFFLRRLKPEFSGDDEGLVPGEAFREAYERLTYT